mmetsp:Transcript_13706/g.27020  ORF Transcript_13706/g.27020 Transcript_13706/m.27020 type:complete len:576 (-) Transcript_13706:142-1869(-)
MGKSGILEHLQGQWSVVSLSAMTDAQCYHDSAGGTVSQGAGDVAGSNGCCVWQGRPTLSQHRHFNILKEGGKHFAAEVESLLSNRSNMDSDAPWVAHVVFVPPLAGNVIRGDSLHWEWEIVNVTDEGLLSLKHTQLKHPFVVGLDDWDVCAAVELHGCEKNELAFSYVFQAHSMGLRLFPSCRIPRNFTSAQNCDQGLPPHTIQPLEVTVWFTFERVTPRPSCALGPTLEGRKRPTSTLEGEERSTAFPLLTVGIVVAVALVLCLCTFALVRYARRCLGQVPPKCASINSSAEVPGDDSFGMLVAEEDLEQIMGRMVEEHRCLRPRDLTILQDVPVFSHATRNLQEGLLHGTTAVAVTTATGDLGNAELMKELQHLRIVTHVNIVNLLGMLLSEETYIQLVLEWVPGASLDLYVSRRRQDGSFEKDLREAAEDAKVPEHQLLIDTARAMQYLHSIQPAVVYKVLKPSKVLVNECVSPPLAKLRITSSSVAISVMEEARVLQHQDVLDFGLVVLFAITAKPLSDIAEIAAAWEVAKQLGCADVGSLCVAVEVIQACMACARPNFTSVYHMLDRAQQ